MDLIKHFVLGIFIGYFVMEICFFIKENTYFKLKHVENFNNKKKIMYIVIFFNGRMIFSIFDKITHHTIISYSMFNLLIINEEIK